MRVEPTVTGYRGANVLVFGATGFVGRALTRALAAGGARLSLAVRDPAARIETAPATDVEILECDVLSRDDVVSAVRMARPDITFNVAGYGVDREERDETLARRINTEFPVVLCNAIAQFRSRHWRGAALVHAGSQAEYGMLRELREDAPARPDTLYGRSKLAGTEGIARCARANGLATVTARLFTLYGPGEQPGRLLSSLIGAAAHTGDLPMTEGTQRVEFTHIDDAVDGLLRLGLAVTEPGLIVNVASGRLTSIREFALTAARLLGMPVERLRFGAIPQRNDTMQYESVSTDRLFALVDWTPRLTVEAGIRRTLEETGLENAAE